MFVLHGTTDETDPGLLVRTRGDGTGGESRSAPPSVWLDWFDLQRPRDAAVTDAGEIDLVARAPDGLHLIRITPSA
jgi:hypothetical protein